MPRKPQPWFRQDRNCWMVTINGKRHNLGEHPQGAKKPAKNKRGLWNAPQEIVDEFHKLMSGEQPVRGDTVVSVLDDFLTWTYENRAKRTADRYKDFCQDFAEHYGHVTVERLHPGFVTKWLNEHGWNATTKRNAITALVRGFNWAVKNRGLERNPIKGMEKPQAKKRTTVVTPEEFDLLLAAVKDQPFKDLLIISYDSGARPQEIKRLEARHVDLGKQRAIIPAEEAKGGIPRAIYFPTDRSMEIIKRLMKKRPTGVLLLNNRSNPWTGYAVKNRMEDLEDVLGRRITHYALRHSFVTRKLLAGVDSHVVASLAGHKNLAMIHNTYSHVAEDHKFMLDAAKKDISGDANGTASEE